MVGPPGSGKTMMARRVAGILPPLTFDEALEVDVDPFGRRPAWRRAHGAAPDAAVPRAASHDFRCRARRRRAECRGPGEISLAHHGVLFLDEMAEFSRRVLEVLRQPLEEGVRADRAGGADGRLPRPLHADWRDEPVPVRLSRRSGRAPAAARRCRSTRYASRLSGPLRDRMDLTVGVGAVTAARACSAIGSAEIVSHDQGPRAGRARPPDSTDAACSTRCSRDGRSARGCGSPRTPVRCCARADDVRAECAGLRPRAAGGADDRGPRGNGRNAWRRHVAEALQFGGQ